MADDDDGPDLSCFDFADSGDEQESREDLLKRHKEEVQQLRADAKARKKAIDKAGVRGRVHRGAPGDGGAPRQGARRRRGGLTTPTIGNTLEH